MTPKDPKPDSVRRPGGHTGSKAGSVTQSQLFPVLSQGVELLRRSFFLPAAITLVTVVLLLATVDSPLFFKLVLGGYMGTVAFYGIYLVCGRQKPWWLILSATGTTIILAGLMVFAMNQITRLFLAMAGLEATEAAIPCTDGSVPLIQRLVGFVIGFVFYLLIAGVPEELLKSVPVFGSRFFGRFLADPLDGIIIGSASGLGFTLLETLGVYAPMFAKDCGELIAVQIILPRTLGAALGHMAWSGYFGYFIGLSALRPRHKWKILATGFLSSAAMHAFWNSAGSLGTLFLIVPGALTLVCFGSAIVRARQMAGIGSTIIPLSPAELTGGTASMASNASTERPSWLHIGSVRIDLAVGRAIYQSDIPGLVASSQDNVVAKVSENPRDPSVIGLTNLSVSSWAVMDPRSGLRKVESGKSVRLLAGTRINFGSIFGEVRG